MADGWWLVAGGWWLLWRISKVSGQARLTA
jgi:hypothetical protein